MDNKTYEISSAEWEVMNIIWMKKYASANNIIEEIQSIINRIEKLFSTDKEDMEIGWSNR